MNKYRAIEHELHILIQRDKLKNQTANVQRKNHKGVSAAASLDSCLLPLEQPLRRAPRTGALCRSALTRAFRPTFSFCMALRASLTEFTTFTMLIWLSDSSCTTNSGRRKGHVYVHSQQFLTNKRHERRWCFPLLSHYILNMTH